jgi:hypothetical protein
MFMEYTYMFWSLSVTILRVYSSKEYNKKLCVANLSKIFIIYKMLQHSKILYVTIIRSLKDHVCRS